MQVQIDILTNQLEENERKKTTCYDDIATLAQVIVANRDNHGRIDQLLTKVAILHHDISILDHEKFRIRYDIEQLRNRME